MKFSLAFLITFASFATAIPAPQRGVGNGQRRQSATAIAPAAVVTGDVVAVPVVSNEAADPAPASSSRVVAPAADTAPASSSRVVAPPAGTGAVSTGSTATGTSDTSDTDSSGDTGTTTGTGAGGDSHTITVVNNCGSGFVEYKFGQGELKTLSDSITLSGSLPSGNMWLQDYDGHTCGPDGTDCGMVEFTLGDNGHNAINYSVLMGVNGNHVLRAPMFIELTGGTCSAKANGPCTGMTVAECPNGYTGLDTNTGPPVDCEGTGVGAKITFCP